ncbi:MAG: DUF2339 domain-containing protein, partial [bacterium]|nr:DUF2339 domain-containing protein [bacterium]
MNEDLSLLKKQVESLIRRVSELEQKEEALNEAHATSKEVSAVEQFQNEEAFYANSNEDHSMEEDPSQEPSIVIPSKKQFEEALGFKWFSRIGILALVLGVVFFLKYAIDNNLISYFARIIIGVVTGTGLVVGGEIIARKEKYRVWARNLVSGGIAITYFSIYAAYHLPAYQEAIGISLSLDLILLSVVAI